MNNNRGNNRRRGRGNNRQQGGSQGNRIDSRARGNAPQLLEKYKKLAHDASLNGDRVQAEYYLQFADHYFRVLADSRVQRDDQQPQRPRQQGDRESSYDEEFRDDDDQGQRVTRDTGRDNGRENGRDRGQDGQRERQDEGSRDREQPEREQQTERNDREEDVGDEVVPTENPFTRDGRGPRPEGNRPNRQGRARREPASPDLAEGQKEDEGPRFDPASLPPPFRAAPEEKPRRKPRKPRGATENDGEELETVN